MPFHRKALLDQPNFTDSAADYKSMCELKQNQKGTTTSTNCLLKRIIGKISDCFFF